jgi:hypothetical protein
MAEKVLEKVNPNRRGFIKRLLGSSFAVPVIATFSIEALSIDSAKAECGYGNAVGQCYEAYIFGFPFLDSSGGNH